MNGCCFKLHRNRVIDILNKGNLEDSLIFMPSPQAPREVFTNSELPFTQEGIFYWLTGWDHPASAIIIDVKNNHSILITPSFDEDYETWYGKAPTDDEIMEQTGVDEVQQGVNAEQFLAEFTSNHIQTIKHRLLAFKLHSMLEIDDLGTLVCAVSIARRTKFEHEIQALRRASVVSSSALVEVMKYCRPEINESDLAAVFLFKGTLLGGKGLSFPTIAASGCQGAYMHYSANNNVAHDGDMVLFDCGLYVEHYAGDITRTFPVSGTFSEIQKKVYNLLLRAQCALINIVKPHVTLYDLEDCMLLQIFEILRQIGVVHPEVEFDREVAKLFCPHSTSHHIGVSVHDWSYYSGKSLLKVDMMEAFRLVPNMVISIEPGIYFNQILLNRYKNCQQFQVVNFDLAIELASTVCAIRIEDDILVTEDGCEVLSICPKKVEDIESIMAKGDDQPVI